MRLLILLTCLFISCSPAASGQGLPNSAGSGTTQTPVCSSYSSSGGKVDIAVPSTDCIDIASNACGVACPANTSINAASGVTAGGTQAFSCPTSSTFSVNCLSGQIQTASVQNSIGANLLVDSTTNLNLGTVTATTTTLGRSGQTTNINGIAAINSSLNLANANLTCNGNSIVTAGTCTLAALGTFTLGTSSGNQELFSAAAAGSAPSIATQGTDANIGLQLGVKGNQFLLLPAIASASFPACTAATYSNTQTKASGFAYDSTNNRLVVCDGTANRGITVTPHDWGFTVNDPVTAVGTTGDIAVWGPTQSASTLQSINWVVPILGGGTGNLVMKISSAAAGGGTVFGTLTIACNAAAGTSCTTGANCTINTAAVPAGTTLHIAITTACTTADVQSNSSYGFSTP